MLKCNCNIDTRTRIPLILIMTAIFIILFCLPVSADAADNTGLYVHQPSQEQIREYVRNHPVDFESKDWMSYDADKPTTDASWYDVGAQGILSNRTQQNALACLNNIRYITGLDPVKITDSEYLRNITQAGAFCNAVIGKSLTHKPSQPSSFSDSLYKISYAGASSSNLALGETNLPQAIFSWIYDTDTTNIAEVGHRRWALNPAMAETAFGSAKAYRSMYAFNRSNNTGISGGVAWPASNTPLEYLGSSGNLAWSYSYGKHLDRSNVSVVLTQLDRSSRRELNRWTFNEDTSSNVNSEKYFNVDNSNIGLTGCVIFRPDGIDSFRVGDLYHVTIRNGSDFIADYDVRIFALKPLEKLCIHSHSSIPVGGNATVGVDLEPADTMDRFYSAETSDDSIITVIHDPYFPRYFEVYARKPGTATVTLRAENGVTARTTVTVFDNEIEIPYSKNFQYDGNSHSPITDSDLYVKSSRFPYADDTISATAPGTYSVHIMPKDGYKWKDGTTGTKLLWWTIEEPENNSDKNHTETTVSPNREEPTPSNDESAAERENDKSKSTSETPPKSDDENHASITDADDSASDPDSEDKAASHELSERSAATEKLKLNKTIVGECTEDTPTTYEITLPEAGRIILTAKTTPNTESDNSGNVTLCDPEGAEIGELFLNHSGDERKYYLKAGSYYIKAVGPGSSRCQFKLTAEFDPAHESFVEDMNHNNDRMTTANPIKFGRTYYGQVGYDDAYDFYSFQAPVAGELKCVVTLKHSANGGLDFQVDPSWYNNELDSLIGRIIFSGKTTEKASLRRGTYYLRMQESNAQYSFKLAFRPTAKVKGLKAKRYGSGRKVRVSYNKLKGATGYQLQISTSKHFPKNKTHSVNLKSTISSKRLTGLRKNKSYYVRIRAYTKVGSETKSCPYSSTLKINK